MIIISILIICFIILMKYKKDNLKNEDLKQ